MSLIKLEELRGRRRWILYMCYILLSICYILLSSQFKRLRSEISYKVEVLLPKAVSSNYILFSILNLLLKFIFKGLSNIRLNHKCLIWRHIPKKQFISLRYCSYSYLQRNVYKNSYSLWKFTLNLHQIKISFPRPLTKALWIISIHANIGTE